MSYTASTSTTAGTPSTDTTTSTGKTAPARPALVRPALVRPALALLVLSPSRIWHELHFYLYYRQHAPAHGSTINGSINVAVFANSTSGIASITITVDGNTYATCPNVTPVPRRGKIRKSRQGRTASAVSRLAQTDYRPKPRLRLTLPP